MICLYSLGRVGDMSSTYKLWRMKDNLMTDETKYLRLDYQLCFAVYATSNAFVRAYNHLLEAFGLTYPAYLIMLILWEEDGQSPGRIARKLHLPVEFVEPVLKSLERGGYIMRRATVSDAKETEILVTSEGEALKKDIARIRGEIGCAIGLDDEKLLGMREGMMDVLYALETEINRLKPNKYNYI